MRKLIFICLVLGLPVISFAQFDYKNKIEPIDGVEIRYKIAHQNAFDKESPVQIRFKFKNTNDYDVKINFELEYQFDLIKRYNSGEIEIEIPRKTAKTGKMHGLVFEINTNDPNIFEKENAEWEFIKFDVQKIEK